MKKISSRILSVLLCAVLVLLSAAPAFAEVFKAEESDKAEYVEVFNAGVNSLKTEMPRATVKYTDYVPKGGLTTGAPSDLDPTSPVNAEEVDEAVEKYLLPVIESMFNNRTSLTKGFIQALFGAESAKTESMTLHKDALRNNAIPLYGKKTVSNLTVADDYDLIVQKEANGQISQMAVAFGSVDLKNAGQSSLSKLFTLPSGTIDPVIISGQPTNLTSRLEGSELSHFTFDDARVIARFDEEGKLTYYGSQIDYNFAISFYDIINLISAVIGYNFYTAVVNTVNVILENIGRESFSAESVLRDRQLFVKYRSIVEVTDIDYSDRYFGDVDDDGKVTPYDSRTALRHAVGLELISASVDRIYTDVDFDGMITPADARLILRAAVGLDELFNTVPAGKTVKIAKVEEEAPVPDEDEEQPEIIKGLLGDWNPDVKLADIASTIMDIINQIGGVGEEGTNLITEFIEAIRAAVEDNRKDKP